MRNKLPFLGAVLVLLFICSRSASADPIIVNFDLTVGFAQGQLEDIFGVPIDVGDLLHGSFSYDPAATDRNPFPNFGSYDGSGQTLQVESGTGLTLPIESLFVFDNALCDDDPNGCDTFAAAANTQGFPGFSVIQIQAGLSAPGNKRQGDTLPQSLDEIASVYGPGLFTLQALANGSDDFSHLLDGTLRLRQTSEPVPEPSTLLLIGTSAGLILRSRIRKSRTLAEEDRFSTAACGGLADLLPASPGVTFRAPSQETS